MDESSKLELDSFNWNLINKLIKLELDSFDKIVIIVIEPELENGSRRTKDRSFTLNQS
jgi:hypothetical protein